MVSSLPEARSSLAVPASVARLTSAPAATRHAQRNLWQQQCWQRQPGCATPAWARMPLSAKVGKSTSSAPLAPSPRVQLPLQPRRRRAAQMQPPEAEPPLLQLRLAPLPSPRPFPPVPPPHRPVTAAWEPDLGARWPGCATPGPPAPVARALPPLTPLLLPPHRLLACCPRPLRPPQVGAHQEGGAPPPCWRPPPPPHLRACCPPPHPLLSARSHRFPASFGNPSPRPHRWGVAAPRWDQAVQRWCSTLEVCATQSANCAPHADTSVH